MPAFADRRRWLLAAFVALSLTVYGRLIALELHDGPEYRAAAAEPIVRKQTTHATRGRILGRDGTVLAYDEPIVALAVHYRWLEEPANPRWLRQTARLNLSPHQRRDAPRVAAEQKNVLQQRRQLAARLAALCGLSQLQWQRRANRVQRRVEAIADGVNARHGLDRESHRASMHEQSSPDDSLVGLVGRRIVEALFALDNPPPTAPMPIAQELSEHVAFEGLPLEAVAEIEAHPQRYPGVKLVRSYRRAYPAATTAAHVLGYLSAIRENELKSDDYHADDRIGRAGVERRYEPTLRARQGLVIEQLDSRGRIKSSHIEQEPASGRDLMLTLDPALQQTAETLLDEAMRRRLPSGDERIDRSSGGAVVVLDVHDGAVLTAAAAPRFDPHDFIRGESPHRQRLLNDPPRPLFDRTIQMALPPGSVFKIVTAAAVLDAGVDARAPVDCQGYLHQPKALRCAVFRRLGVGHGPMTLADALARSCNVYFFHHAEQLGPAPLIDWAQRFGLGTTTGVDLLGEVSGSLPQLAVGSEKLSASESSPPSPIDPRPISIGQGTVTVTPLQAARMTAAIANGGQLVTPHVAERVVFSSDEVIKFSPPQPIPGLNADVLAAIRKGLRQAVADEHGTAHATADLAEVAIAGKTGTAQTGGGRPNHAWFTGYAPADRPRAAFVVVLEHAGDGAIAAGPVAKHLVARMNELGYFKQR